MKIKLNSVLYAHGFKNKNNKRQMLYIRLSNAIISAILNKELVKGDQLPPTRLLAKDLVVSRSTVIKAYDVLNIKRYISSKQGSGYFVNDIDQDIISNRLDTIKNFADYPKTSKRAQEFSKQVTLLNRGGHTGIAFRPGLPPLDVFPVKQWQKLTNAYWKDITFSEMSYRSPLGLESLRRNIAKYVKMYRNIHCDYSQIVVVTGSLHSLSLIGDLLLNENDQVVLEDPTYANAIAIFKSLRAKLIPTEIDKEGLSITSLRNHKSLNPKLVYTIPSNQYPTGVQMSLKRRLELLSWATTHNCLIIEDDYDHEFSNWEQPTPSIFGLDTSDRVIYQGTFNKLLHPSIRLGYLIVPPYLVDSIQAIYEQSLRFVSPVTQKVMSDFIEKDYLSQHIREVVQVSNARRRIFTDCFNTHFKDNLVLEPVNTGLHLIARLADEFDDVALSDFLEKNKINTFPYSKYFIKDTPKKGLVMGFSSVSPPIIKDTILKMSQLFEEFTKFKN